jgi:isopropylmalate/homocitrate/citramalate synthase
VVGIHVEELAIRSGASTINIPDTVGYTTPQEYVALISTRSTAKFSQGRHP